MKRLVLTIMLCVPLLAAAQSWPTARPITLIVPFPPGGNVDFAARVLATRFSETLKQSVIVENVPGAGGVIGVSKAVAAPADGYTLLVGVDSAISIAKFVTPTAVRYDSLRDLAPIGIINAAPMIILAKPALPADNVADLIKQGKTLDQIKASRPALPYETRYGTQAGVTSAFVESIYKSLQAKKS